MSDRSVIVVLALGSNLGDRRFELRRAIEKLGEHVRLSRISQVIETEPVDAPEGSGRFLNQVVAGTTRLLPRELLREISSIERERGRRRIARNEPRRIDVDIIVYGGLRMRTSDLTIPHPRCLERDFVMSPIRELGLAGLVR